MEDDYFVKTDLWQLASAALTLMDLFYGVNLKYKVIDFHPLFQEEITTLARTTDAQLDEMKASDRYKRALEKYVIKEKS
jgi:hypothetical protein